MEIEFMTENWNRKEVIVYLHTMKLAIKVSVYFRLEIAFPNTKTPKFSDSARSISTNEYCSLI